MGCGCIAILIVIIMLFIVIPRSHKTYYGSTVEEISIITKPRRSSYVTCPDILNPGKDKCRVKSRDASKSCKRPTSKLSDSCLDI